MDRERSGDKLHPETFAKMQFLLTLLRDRGEDALFRFLRRVVLKEVPFEKWEEMEKTLL